MGKNVFFLVFEFNHFFQDLLVADILMMASGVAVVSGSYSFDSFWVGINWKSELSRITFFCASTGLMHLKSILTWGRLY